jgi:hypothetical protein
MLRASSRMMPSLSSSGATSSSQHPLLYEDVPVKHHADGDEEQPQQHVMEGADIRAHLVPVLGFGHQHSGDEGAQRQAQPGQLGQPGQAQGDEQQVQHEQLFALAPRHLREPPAHELLPARQQQPHQHRGLDQRQAQRQEQLVGRRAQRGHQHQQRHHRQILEQQNAHDLAPVFALQLGALGQELADDGRTAHGHGAGQGHGRLPTHVPHAAQPACQHQRADHRCQHRGRHLQQTQPEHLLAHGAQLGQG